MRGNRRERATKFQDVACKNKKKKSVVKVEAEVRRELKV